MACGNSVSAVLARCESCNFDLRRSRSANCANCDKTFSADLTDSSDDQDVSCPDCGDGSTVFVFADEQTQLCKHCHHEALRDYDTELPGETKPATEELNNYGEPRCTTCGTCSRENLLPVNFSDCCWTAWCINCKRNFDVTNDFAACPTCGTEYAEKLKAPKSLPETAMRICRQCATLVQDNQTYIPAEASANVPDYSNELWRFVGCVCGNHEAHLFRLVEAAHPTKSCYCRDCEQPYSAFLWNNEMPGGQCPRCNGPNVEMDAIQRGDEVIECLMCDGKVSLRRHDNQVDDIRQEVENELNTGDSAHQQARTTTCLQCGEPGAELGLSLINGDIWMMQICDKCGSAEPLANFDQRADEKQEQQHQLDEQLHKVNLQQAPATPAGFEELNHTCGRMDHLHPVEDDSGDNLLVCDLCINLNKPQLICLSNLKSPTIPKSVSALRIKLKDTFSSGEMGLPRHTKKVDRIEEIKPGDHLEFKRTLYSHHGIAVAVYSNKQELAVVEYTGQSDAPTVLACLSSAPSKAHVARTLLRFPDIVQSLYRIDYFSLDCFLPSAVIRRALERRDEKKYNFGTSNCEHLSIWAKSNLDLSRQVDAFKEKGRKVLEHPAFDLVQKGAKGALGLITKRPLGIIFDVIEDVRIELLRLFCMRKGASSKILRTVLRLGLKWAIRGLPFLIAALLKLPCLMPALLYADNWVFKPLSEKLADKLLPIKDEDCTC